MNSKTREKRADYWRRIVNEHKRSGLAVGRFCLQAHINEHTFYNRRKRRRDEAAPVAEPVRFALAAPAKR